MSTKTIITTLLLLAIPQSEQIVTPKVEHKVESHTETKTTDTVTLSCPEGYEGHYVDPLPGFGIDYYLRGGNGLSVPYYYGGGDVRGDAAYAVCFKKDFIEKLRKDPDLNTNKPLLPRGV